MKLLSSLILLIIFSTLLNAAYLRTIRVGSFKSNTEAQRSLIALKAFIAKHDNVVQLQKKWNFEVKSRKSGKYYVTMVEPLTDREVLQEVLDTLRLGYKGVYVTKLQSMPAKKTTISIPQTIEIQEIKKEKTMPKPKEELVVKTMIPEPIETIPTQTPTVEKIENEVVNAQKEEGLNYLWPILFFITLIGLIVAVMRLMEETGVGMDTFRSMREKHNLPLPIINYKQPNLIVKFPRNLKGVKDSSERLKGLNEDLLHAYEFVKLKQEVTRKEYEEFANISQKVAYGRLTKLKDQELIGDNGKSPGSKIFKYVFINKQIH